MKRIAFILVVWLCLGSWAQGQSDSLLRYPVNESGLVEYKDVVEVPNTAKSEIQKRVKAWFGKKYNSATSVIQTETEDNIIAKPAMTIMVQWNKMVSSSDWHYTLSIDFKDNKCRIVANPIEANEWQKVPKSEYDKMGKNIKANSIRNNNSYVNQHNEYFKILFTDFRNSITKKDDW